MSNPVTGVESDDASSGEFGANEWLVDELYERYRQDKNSVDRSWWPVLESYHPVDPTPTQSIALPAAEVAAPEPVSSEPLNPAEPAVGAVTPDPPAEPAAVDGHAVENAAWRSAKTVRRISPSSSSQACGPCPGSVSCALPTPMKPRKPGAWRWKRKTSRPRSS